LKLQRTETDTMENIDLSEPMPPQAKPVIRSEATIPETTTATTYFPVSNIITPPFKPDSPAVTPMPLISEAVPTQIVPEDQVNFLQKLFLEQMDEDEEGLGADTAAIEEMETLIFQLGNENYGMDIQQIAEIIRFQEPTHVPNTIGFLDGIISLRGRMIPVINGRKRLGHTPHPPDKKTRIIVLQDNTELHGILVDSASQVLRLPKNAIEPTPSVVVGVDAEFVNGVCEHKSQLIILLNLERFLQFH